MGKDLTQEETRALAMSMAAGVVAGVITMARDSMPPEGMSAKEALTVFADAIEKVARGYFGEERWEGFQGVIKLVEEAGVKPDINVFR